MHRIMALMMVMVMMAGCTQEAAKEIVCEAGDSYSYEWDDSYQWNTAPMSYANSTLLVLNNTTTENLTFDIVIKTYFSEPIGPLGQGWLNVSMSQNDTVLWSNQTTNDGNFLWKGIITVNNTQELWLEIRAAGKDTHPENDMGDYFVMDWNGEMQQPEVCMVNKG